MIRNLLAVIGFVVVALAGAAGLYAAGWSRLGPDEDVDGVRRMAVSTAGLDLSTIAGQDLLDRRVEAAIDRVCRDDRRSAVSVIGDERRCRRDARIGADRQIAAAVERATRRAYYARAYDERVMGDAPYDEADYAPPPPAYAPPPVYTAAEPVVRSIDTMIVRRPLKPRVKWVRTRHGLVKKTVHRKLVRKTVKTVYVRPRWPAKVAEAYAPGR